MTRVIVCVLVLAFVCNCTGNRNPGFRARITDKALKYANSVAIEALKKQVDTLTIPDQSGSASGFDYEITNIHVTAFNPPVSIISSVPGVGLEWKASNAYIAMHGDFRYHKWFVSDSGSFDAKVAGVKFDLGINITNDTTGRPSIRTSKCSDDIGDVGFEFHGGMAWLYNLFSDKVGDVIKDNLKGQLCKIAVKEIDEDGEQKMKEIPVTTQLADKFLLDYRLVQKPNFTQAFMETYHKGEIYWLADPNTESPLLAPPMPQSADTQNMLYLWVSDYTFNTLGYVAQKHSYLRRNITARDLPESSRGVLNTTCDGFIPKCIGKLIPGIGKKYPNQIVELHMKSTMTPFMSLSFAGVAINCSGTIDLFARKPGAADVHYLATLNASMSTSVKLAIEDGLVIGQIKDLNLKLKAAKSDVGPIHDDFMDFLIKQALKVYLIPQLNDLGKRGFPLPVTKEFKFLNTKLSFARDTLEISTDLQYTTNMRRPLVASDAAVGPDSDVLRFQRHHLSSSSQHEDTELL